MRLKSIIIKNKAKGGKEGLAGHINTKRRRFCLFYCASISFDQNLVDLVSLLSVIPYPSLTHMAPTPWATPMQTEWLHSQMPDFIRRQAEQKLHLFWPPMLEAWCMQWPEHSGLNLPLPNDPSARKLTDDELVTLGIAIQARKSVSYTSFLSPTRQN